MIKGGGGGALAGHSAQYIERQGRKVTEAHFNRKEGGLLG